MKEEQKGFKHKDRIMNMQASTDNKNEDLLFLPSLFHETMDMIFESYEYFQFQEKMADNYVPAYLHAIYSHEMSRITMRLTSVMAWLMARKAVSAGQVDANIGDQYRLDAVEECLEQNQEMEEYMPDYMRQLLQQSFDLYQRVYRLDQQIIGRNED